MCVTAAFPLAAEGFPVFARILAQPGGAGAASRKKKKLPVNQRKRRALPNV
jgi:hypothetical protein